MESIDGFMVEKKAAWGTSYRISPHPATIKIVLTGVP
jgi:hypothetical protein